MTKTNTTPAAALETLQRVPLASLKLAPENARFGSKDLGDIAGLAGSITAIGDLLDPLHVYPQGADFMVWDGGRRLAALTKLQKLPPALAAGVPVLVSASQAEGLLRSRATFVREGLDAAEEFVTYKALKDAGQSPELIAAACSVATPRVKQLLRLCDVAPVILEAFKARKVPLDVVEAFSVSPDHDKQLSVWKSYEGKKAPEAFSVKQALRKGALGPNDPIANFVGREAYEKAGGKFLIDLFSGRGDEAWADGDLARKLHAEKLAALIDKVKAEGWSWVKAVEAQDYYYSRGLTKLPKPPGGKWSPETMAASGAFITFKYNGDVDVEGGWATPAKANKVAPGAARVKLSTAQPALYGFGHLGHLKITEAATKATQVGLMRKPDVAYDALLSHLAWVEFGPMYNTREGTASRLTVEQRNGHRATVTVEGQDELKAVRDRFEALLKPLHEDRVAFCEAVAALKPAAKAELLAYCFGQSLYAAEEKIDYAKPVRWSHLGWMAAKAGVQPALAWIPDAEFLKGGSRDALTDAIKDLTAGTSIVRAGGWAAAKKGEMVKFVADKAPQKGWTPKLFATFTDVLPPAKDAEEFSPALKALAGAGKPAPIKG